MARPRTRSRIEDHHAEWLSLVETSGPFLTVPTLKRALPNGLEATPSAMSALRIAHAEWREDPGLQARWVRWVLDDVLELRDAARPATDADPSHRVAEQGVTLRPSFVVRDATQENALAVLLVHRYPAGTSLDRPVPGEAWAASPIDRAAELARASEVELALVTDGSRWTMVWARRGETTGTCTLRTELWLEEPVTLRAFATLLGARRVARVRPPRPTGPPSRRSPARSSSRSSPTARAGPWCGRDAGRRRERARGAPSSGSRSP
ncbi:MAG: hypothetical protein ACR2NB_06150 [Solirubrobacteraceae bacterium]